jgi:hypothetical protein
MSGARRLSWPSFPFRERRLGHGPNWRERPQVQCAMCNKTPPNNVTLSRPVHLRPSSPEAPSLDLIPSGHGCLTVSAEDIPYVTVAGSGQLVESPHSIMACIQYLSPEILRCQLRHVKDTSGSNLHPCHLSRPSSLRPRSKNKLVLSRRPSASPSTSTLPLLPPTTSSSTPTPLLHVSSVIRLPRHPP